ncbi:MAG: deoxyribonuclease IV [Patescibacteria group bacterium]
MAKNQIKFNIGCHVSIAGGVWNAPKSAHDLGCETFQIFTRSPQGGPAPELTPEVIAKFKAEMEKHQFTDFVVHCPYYINFGSGKSQTYHSSISIVRGELERTSLLGGQFVMFHTGSGKDLGKAKAILQAQEGLKKVLDGYKGQAKLLIEIAAGAGEILGDTFEEVAELMEPLKKHPGFGGVCFDTQHAWASGYDVSKKDWIKQFGNVIGLEWLKMSHINDSKVELGSHKDRHEHIGEGLIGKKGFGGFLGALSCLSTLSPPLRQPADLGTLPPGGESNNVAYGAMPLILETEHDKVKADIKILKSLRDNLKK